MLLLVTLDVVSPGRLQYIYKLLHCLSLVPVRRYCLLQAEVGDANVPRAIFTYFYPLSPIKDI